MIAEISPRVQVVAQLIQRLNQQELQQLFTLVPVLSDRQPSGDETLVAHFRALGTAQRGGRNAQPDDLFIGGLTYAQYFGLSTAEQDALWDQLFAEAPLDLETITEIDLAPHANLPAR